jgi:glycosyltransferase involved in cell wall biosynthesis
LDATPHNPQRRVAAPQSEAAGLVLALIPAWNEAARIGPVLQGVLAHLPALVVDDGSSDGTVRVAEELGATVVRHAANRGKGAALRTGFAWALAHGYGAVLTLDADAQHAPSDIPKFLAARARGAGELIIGRRCFRHMPFPRPITTPLGNWLLSRALAQPIRDNQSGYRLYTRRFLEAARPTTSGFELEVEVIAQAVCLGLPIGWVEIETIYGTGKKSYFHPLRDTAKFLRMVWRAYRARRAAERGARRAAETQRS